jgi:hypothetical protein
MTLGSNLLMGMFLVEFGNNAMHGSVASEFVDDTQFQKIILVRESFHVSPRFLDDVHLRIRLESTITVAEVCQQMTSSIRVTQLVITAGLGSYQIPLACLLPQLPTDIIFSLTHPPLLNYFPFPITGSTPW